MSESRDGSSQDQSANLRGAAAQVYRHSRLFHGTSGSHLGELRSMGFDKKRPGATEVIRRITNVSDEFVADASRNHYFTMDLERAQEYAFMADRGNRAVVRTIGLHAGHPMEPDPDTALSGAGMYLNFRTAVPVPPKFVLGSKRGKSRTKLNENAEVFRSAMHNAGHDISQAQAGKLLREVQSDSDDDFPTQRRR